MKRKRTTSPRARWVKPAAVVAVVAVVLVGAIAWFASSSRLDPLQIPARPAVDSEAPGVERQVYEEPVKYANAKKDKPRCDAAVDAVKRLTSGDGPSSLTTEQTWVLTDQLRVVSRLCSAKRAAAVNSTFVVPFFANS